MGKIELSEEEKGERCVGDCVRNTHGPDAFLKKSE